MVLDRCSVGGVVMKSLILIVLWCFFSWSAYARTPSAVAQEIEYLIEKIEHSECSYHRNGKSHDAIQAADHLRLKLRRGKKYADTAEHFIERLASKSSWTGKSYFLECQPGHLIEVSPWMKRHLLHYRQRMMR